MNDATTEAVIRFDSGIPGFPGSRRFRLTATNTDSAFQMLESLDEDGVAVIVTEPWIWFGDYELDLDESDRAALELADAADAAVMCTVTVDAEAGRAWTNLRAPIVVNTVSRAARQVVLGDEQPLRAVLPLEW